MKMIGAFEAKTHLSELLASVAKGESYIITVRGKPMASLSPISNPAQEEGVRNRIMAFRKQNAHMLSSLSYKELKSFKEEGRK